MEFFKARASEPNAAPYQTQINVALRAFMEKSATVVDPEVSSLLSNETFVSALAERIRKRIY